MKESTQPSNIVDCVNGNIFDLIHGRCEYECHEGLDCGSGACDCDYQNIWSFLELTKERGQCRRPYDGVLILFFG